MGGVVLEATGFRRIMRGSDHNAVGQAGLTAVIVAEDGMGDSRGGRVLIVVRQHHLNLVGGQDFHRAGQRGPRERMGIDAQEERPVDLLLLAIEANCLGDGQDVPFVKGPVEGGTAVARGAKDNPLLGYLRIGPILIVGGD